MVGTLLTDPSPHPMGVVGRGGSHKLRKYGAQVHGGILDWHKRIKASGNGDPSKVCIRECHAYYAYVTILNTVLMLPP